MDGFSTPGLVRKTGFHSFSLAVVSIRSVAPSADREANGFFSVQRAESVKFFRTTGSPAAANSAEPAIRAVAICLAATRFPYRRTFRAGEIKCMTKLLSRSVQIKPLRHFRRNSQTKMILLFTMHGERVSGRIM